MKFNPKKLFTPDPDFNQRAKRRYLAAFDTQFGTRPSSDGASRVAGWIKGLVILGSFAAIMLSVSAYADTANVAADNPLYPFKRLSENVRIVLTPKAEKARVEVSIAARRANEIDDLSGRKPSSTLLAGLSEDFQSAVSSSFGAIDNENNGRGFAKGGLTNSTTSANPSMSAGIRGEGKNGKNGSASTTETSTAPDDDRNVSSTDNDENSGRDTTTVCHAMAVIFSNSIQARLEILNNAELLKRFQARCGGTTNASATTSGIGTVSASTTIIILPGSRKADESKDDSGNTSGESDGSGKIEFDL